MARRRRSSPPTGKPLKYQAMCLRRSLAAVLLVLKADQQLGMPAQHARPPRRGSGRVWVGTAGESVGQVAEQPGPAEAAAADDDAVDPGLARPSAARPAASQMSPLPSTGIDTCAFRAAMASQSACPAYACCAVRPCSAIAAQPDSSAIRPASRKV